MRSIKSEIKVGHFYVTKSGTLRKVSSINGTQVNFEVWKGVEAIAEKLASGSEPLWVFGGSLQGEVPSPDYPGTTPGKAEGE